MLMKYHSGICVLWYNKKRRKYIWQTWHKINCYWLLSQWSECVTNIANKAPSVGKPCPPSRDVAKPVDYHKNVGMAYMAGMVTANTGLGHLMSIFGHKPSFTCQGSPQNTSTLLSFVDWRCCRLGKIVDSAHFICRHSFNRNQSICKS